MKVTKTIILTLFLGLVTQATQAQLTRADVFDAEKFVFYGLDFSNAKLIGSHGFSNPRDIKNRFFYNWNRLMFNEKNKYDLGKAYGNKLVRYDFTVVDKRNELPDEDALVIDSEYELPGEDLQSILNEYEGGDVDEGLGLVYIVESFNKSTDYAYIWVTFFDISTRKVLLARRMRGKTGGFGLRNYWAGSIHNIIKDSRKAYRGWERG